MLAAQAFLDKNWNDPDNPLSPEGPPPVVTGGTDGEICFEWWSPPLGPGTWSDRKLTLFFFEGTIDTMQSEGPPPPPFRPIQHGTIATPLQFREMWRWLHDHPVSLKRVYGLPA